MLMQQLLFITYFIKAFTFCKEFATVFCWRSQVKMLVRSYLRETIDGIVYKSIESESEMIEVINMFFGEFTEDVPINKFLLSHFDMIARSVAWENNLKKSIEEGVSLIAVEEKTNNIVGFKINSIVDLKSTSEIEEPICDVEESKVDFLKSDKLDLFEIIEFLCTEMADINDLLLEKIPTLQMLFYSFAVGTLRNFRGRSIGFNLHKYSVQIARSIGAQCITVFAANPITVKIISKLNYRKIKSKAWNTFEFNGKKLFAEYQNGADYATTVYLDLTN
ncbi:uncharacterized protein LOC100208005 isoform X1 [Hydra vulgaris]|uniref:uncharacterized protein LOC100208005 isoform X1 n=1 Tax=Hydra vulgaris TaxID=6087 RepID=UPI0032EA84EC